MKYKLLLFSYTEIYGWRKFRKSLINTTTTMKGKFENMNRTVTINQLAVGANIVVRGKLGYSRLTSQIAGEELRKQNERNQSRGQQPVSRPYTTATIYDASVICKDPNHLSNEEIYAQESLYTSVSAAGSQRLNCFTGNNKGNNLPWIAVARSDGSGFADKVAPEGELAQGLDVTLILRVFKGRVSNNGISLDGVIVNEPIRYYTPANDANLAAYGIQLAGNPAPVQPAVAAPVQTQPPMYPANEPAPAAPFAPQFQPQPQAPAPAPQVTQPPQPAPAAPFAPVPNPYSVPTTGQNPSGIAPAQTPADGNGIKTGYRYDPADNRNY